LKLLKKNDILKSLTFKLNNPAFAEIIIKYQRCLMFFLTPVDRFFRIHIPEMGDGRDGDVGRDDGVRDAGMPGHHTHANGDARSGAGTAHRPGDGLSARLLPGAEATELVGVQPVISGGYGDGTGARARRPQKV